MLDNDKYKVHEGTRKGAYILETFGKDIILVATGSEVAMIMKAALELKDAGILATVVSMPSFTIFEEQDDAYKMSIFPHGVPKISARSRRDHGLVEVCRAARASPSASIASALRRPAPSPRRSSASRSRRSSSTPKKLLKK